MLFLNTKIILNIADKIPFQTIGNLGTILYKIATI